MFTETLMKLLVRCLVLLENHFTLTYCSNKFFVTFWKLICSLADTPHWLDDAKECIQSGWSKQRDCWSLTHEMLVALKAVFLENYLTVSTWIWNGSSIECHEKKHHPFIYLVFDLEARRLKFLDENQLGAGAVENELSTLDSVLCRVVRVNAKPTKSLKFAILSRKSFVTSKQFKWKV